MQESADKSTLTPVCPFVGLINDPSTSMTYPSVGNHCFNCKVPRVPRLEHQAAYCLTEKHATCVAFGQPKSSPFPKEIQQPGHRHTKSGNLIRRWLPGVIGILALAAILGLVIQVLSAGKLPPATPAIATAATRASVPILAPSASPSLTSAPSLTSLPNTSTPAPSLSPGLTISPTDTLTSLPGLTFTPMLTGIPTRTFTPSATSSSTPKPTFTATLTSTPRPTITPSFTPTLRPTLTPSLTATLKPSITPSLTPTPRVHDLETLIQVGNLQFILHRVQTGEGYEILARKYNTTTSTIQALNDSTHPQIWAGFVVVLLPGVLSPDPAWPIFKAYQVLEKQISADDLATKLKVDPTALKYYNACADVCQLSIGDWLLVPYP